MQIEGHESSDLESDGPGAEKDNFLLVIPKKTLLPDLAGFMRHRVHQAGGGIRLKRARRLDVPHFGRTGILDDTPS